MRKFKISVFTYNHSSIGKFKQILITHSYTLLMIDLLRYFITLLMSIITFRGISHTRYLIVFICLVQKVKGDYNYCWFGLVESKHNHIDTIGFRTILSSSSSPAWLFFLLLLFSCFFSAIVITLLLLLL